MRASGEDEPVVPRRPEAREDERWQRAKALGAADRLASMLTGLAIALTAIPLYRGLLPREPRAFVAIAPLCGAALFVTLLCMFAERERHGVARAGLVMTAVVLAASATAFSTALPVGAGKVLLSYWLPAVLAMIAALVLNRGHHQAGPSGGTPLAVRQRAQRLRHPLKRRR